VHLTTRDKAENLTVTQSVVFRIMTPCVLVSG